MFERGQKVKTTDKYYRQTNRMCWGVVKNINNTNARHIVVVHVLKQDGKIVLEHENSDVVFFPLDLEPDSMLQ